MGEKKKKGSVFRVVDIFSIYFRPSPHVSKKLGKIPRNAGRFQPELNPPTPSNHTLLRKRPGSPTFKASDEPKLLTLSRIPFWRTESAKCHPWIGRCFFDMFFLKKHLICHVTYLFWIFLVGLTYIITYMHIHNEYIMQRHVSMYLMSSLGECWSGNAKHRIALTHADSAGNTHQSHQWNWCVGIHYSNSIHLSKESKSWHF